MTLQQIINETVLRMINFYEESWNANDASIELRRDGYIDDSYLWARRSHECYVYAQHYRHLLRQLAKIQKKVSPAVFQIAKNIERRCNHG